MNLYLLRHGLAATGSALFLMADHRRPLTKEGLKKTRKAARAIQAMGLTFDRIWSSPFLRARQTAEIVVQNLKSGKRLECVDELAVGATPRALLQRLAKLRPAPQDILLVGHEPFLTNLAALLISGSPDVGVQFKKGALAKISAPAAKGDGRAVLEWLLTPRQLSLIARGA